MRNFAACRLARAVARCNVRNFVRHHTGQFRLVISFQNEACLHEEKSAGKREGVHGWIFNHLDGKRHFGVGVARQILADAGLAHELRADD